MLDCSKITKRFLPLARGSCLEWQWTRSLFLWFFFLYMIIYDQLQTLKQGHFIRSLLRIGNADDPGGILFGHVHRILTFSMNLIIPRLHLAPARGSDSPRESDSARGFFPPRLHTAPARGADSPRVSDRQLPTILRRKSSVWDCVRNCGTSTGSSQSIAGADSAFCLHYKKLPCQTRLAGRILPFCWGRKGESDPPRGAGDLRLHWGKKASQTSSPLGSNPRTGAKCKRGITNAKANGRADITRTHIIWSCGNNFN